MQLTSELISRGFSLQNAGIDDLDSYIDVKRACYKKYVDEYYGGWVEDIQVKMNTDAFNEMMKETCFKKLLLNNEPVGYFAYNERGDKIDGFSVQFIEAARNKGIGSLFLRYIISLSNETNKPVFLKVFKSNPAQNLYKRFNFEIYCETASHHLMKYTPV